MLKGDGWMHAGGDGEELDRLLARLAEIRKAEGDDRDDFEVHVISYDAYDPDGVKRLEDKGVTDCIVGLPGALHRRPRHRAAGEEGRAPRAVRGEHHRQGEPMSGGFETGASAPPQPIERHRLNHLTKPFTDAVAEAEELIRNAEFIRTEQDLDEGYAYLAGRIRASLQMAFDHDLEHPVLINSTHQFARQGLDNPDALYWSAYLDGDAEYVVRGRRGTTADLSFQVMGGSLLGRARPPHRWRRSTTASSRWRRTARSSGGSGRCRAPRT